MDIYFKNTDTTPGLVITVNDDSYRYRAIKGDHNLTLHFSLAKHVEIPVGAWCMFEAERYELEMPSNFKKKNTRNFEYTLIMESVAVKAKKYKFRNPVDRRLMFSLTAKPREHLQVFIDNMNARDSGWTIGECIEAPEKLISYNHAFCIDALTQQADEFETEYEFVGKKVSLHKVEYNKTNPLPLAYGKGNGFKPGIGRANYDDTKPIEVLYVQGGEENIDASKYGSKELLLPKNSTLRYDGTHFEGESGFDTAKARGYVSDADGFSLRRSDKPLITSAENSLDCSHIYPKRIGGISKVEIVNAAKNFYDFIDKTIPADLNYNDCLIAGETMTVIFQAGMLAGKELEVKYYHEAKTVNGVHKAARRFEIVPQEIDGVTMPNDAFKPVAGQDTYAVFNISLPTAYVCNDATKSGASWEMFRESIKYLYENEGQKFTFTGELDGAWAKRDWLNIGGKIRLGGYILFSDTQFQQESVAIRIVGIKDFINKPHSPEIELSNQVIGSSFTSTLGKIEENEVVVEDNRKEALAFTKRRFRDAVETISMLNDALLDNFSNSINPLTVQTMAMLVGDESLQFRFVNNKTNPLEVSHNVMYNQTTKVLNAPSGIIQHLTLGINTISAEHKAAEYKFWSLPQFNTPPLVDGTKQYYLYAKVSTTDQTGSFYISEKAIKMDGVSGFYHLLMGVLNSEFDETRSYVSLYGFTEILPGRITTDRIVSSDGKTYFDLSIGEIGGRIVFKSSTGENKTLLELESAAASDATAKSNAAKAASEAYAKAQAEAERVKAEAYADGVVTKEEARAIADATAKANAARDAAIAAAAADATAKDSSLLSYANEETDKKIARFGATIIEGGYLKNSMIDTDTIVVKNIYPKGGESLISGFLFSDELMKSFSKSGNNPAMSLNGKLGKFHLESNYTGGDWSLDHGASIIDLDAALGEVVARNNNGVAYLSASGIFCNNPKTNAFPASSGFTHYGSIVGLGFANVARNEWSVDSEDTIVAGVYGRASNSGTAPAYGGFFYNLYAAGLTLRRKSITTSSSNTYLSPGDSMIIGYTSNSPQNIYLPAGTMEGTVIFVKQWWNGTMRFYPRSGQLIYDDTSANDYYEFGEGQGGMFIFTVGYVNGAKKEAWLVSKWRF